MCDSLHYYKLYYRIAAKAIEEELLTEEQRDIIARVGRRKERYWLRHCRDLIHFLYWKMHSPWSPLNVDKDE